MIASRLSAKAVAPLVALTLALAPATTGLSGCGSDVADTDTATATATTDTAGTIADGSYEVQVTTDSSMFRCEHCVLDVADGTLTAHLSLPGEGFSRLFFGTAEEAATADPSLIYDYYLNDEGLYTFDVPVVALDEDLTIAAFGQRRDTWYDHTICFSSPTANATD